jgi:hypothetical protein
MMTLRGAMATPSPRIDYYYNEIYDDDSQACLLMLTKKMMI